MKKILAAITFATGALFGVLFTSKKGDEVRKKLSSKKSTEGRAEVLGEEAKDLAKNFWSTVKGPLQKFSNSMQSSFKSYQKKYGPQAKKKFGEWKLMAGKELNKDLKIAGKQLKKTVKKAGRLAVKEAKMIQGKVKKAVKKKGKK
jgi:hypothetical protein